MTKHTPGPWSAGALDRIVTGSDKTVAHAAVVRFSEEEIKANSHLIAAAPEMLEALELMLLRSKAQNMPSDSVTLKTEDAIRKAKGEV